MAKNKEKDVTSESVFVETLKVVHIAQRLEEEGEREITDTERLRMLDLHKKFVRTAAEAEEMEKEELRLKRKIRFPEVEVIGVPADKIETVQRNYEIEKEEAARIIVAKYKQLYELKSPLQEVQEVLQDLILLEDKKAAAKFIEDILTGKVIKNPGRERGGSPHLKQLQRFSRSFDLVPVKQTVEKLIRQVEKNKKV